MKIKRKITPIAATNVKMKETMTIIVAINRVESNIVCNCLNGPIKKHVLN